MTRQYTQRGFGIYGELTDLYGSTIRIQESSLATDNAVWIFATNPDNADPSPHLSVEQAREVVKALEEFINDYE